jgi:Domain of unknown function (DUF4260)
MTTATLNLVAAPAVTNPAQARGFVTAGPKTLLRLEGLVMLIAAVAGFRALGGSWDFFAAAFLVPDLTMLGYLAGSKVGAAAYNAGHSLIGPLLLAAVALLSGNTMAWLCTLIWVAHIGFDRAAGYGLKYASAFGHTHLGHVGKNGLG